MNDSISRQKFREALYHEAFEIDSEEQMWNSGCWVRYKMVERILDSMPSAQPEIVRCKDCEWWEKQKDSLQGRCTLMQMYPTGEWFCGNAQERRTDE